MKKVLIISYYWPPAGGMGVQRWLKLSKYLHKLGCEVYVYTPSNPSFPIIDEELKPEKGIHIVSQPIIEPYYIAEKLFKNTNKYKAGHIDKKEKQSVFSKISLFIRANFFIPDARFLWIKPSVRFLHNYISENDIHNIITTGPPHSMHRIGYGLKKKNNNLNWIADFRDPWTEIDYYDQMPFLPWADKKQKNQERKVLQEATHVVSVTPTLSKDLKRLSYTDIEAHTITNGFDPEDFFSSPAPQDNHFILSHIGGVNQDRNPIAFWHALNDWLTQNPIFASNFRLQFVGIVDPIVIDEIKKLKTLSPLTSFVGQINRSEALKKMNESSLLLLLMNQNTHQKWRMTGKIFEYIATGIPILCISQENTDASDLINQEKLGKAYLIGQEAKQIKYIQEKLRNFIEEKETGKRKTAGMETSANKYSYQKLAEVYEKLLI